MTYFCTCRLCGKSSFEPGLGMMVQYGVRHYAHAGCALKRWGEAFFDRLHGWQLRRFPKDVAKTFGLEKSLKARLVAFELSEANS